MLTYFLNCQNKIKGIIHSLNSSTSNIINKTIIITNPKFPFVEIKIIIINKSKIKTIIFNGNT